MEGLFAKNGKWIHPHLFALVETHNASDCHPQHDHIKDEHQAEKSHCGHRLHCVATDIASGQIDRQT